MGGLLVLVVLAVLVLALLFSGIGLVIAVLAWMVAGMIAGHLLRGRGYGPLGDVLLGLAGGFIGSLVLGLLRLGWVGNAGLIGNVLVGVVGALILVWAVRALGDRNFGR